MTALSTAPGGRGRPGRRVPAPRRRRQRRAAAALPGRHVPARGPRLRGAARRWPTSASTSPARGDVTIDEALARPRPGPADGRHLLLPLAPPDRATRPSSTGCARAIEDAGGQRARRVELHAAPRRRRPRAGAGAARRPRRRADHDDARDRRQRRRRRLRRGGRRRRRDVAGLGRDGARRARRPGDPGRLRDRRRARRWVESDCGPARRSTPRRRSRSPSSTGACSAASISFKERDAGDSPVGVPVPRYVARPRALRARRRPRGPPRAAAPRARRRAPGRDRC